MESNGSLLVTLFEVAFCLHLWAWLTAFCKELKDLMLTLVAQIVISTGHLTFVHLKAFFRFLHTLPCIGINICNIYIDIFSSLLPLGRIVAVLE